MSERYLKDYAAGQTFGSGRVRVDKESIIAFAAEFDPQPFHLDEALAADTFFRALAASGWHTAAMTMRLLVHGELKPAGGIVGTGFDEFRWPRPVRWRRTACRERNTGGPAVKIPSEPGDHQGVHDDVQSE